MSRILLVDDDEPFRAMVKAMLTRQGHDVVEARDGNEALARFRDAPKAIDLVITDLIMPEREGLDTIQELRRMDPGVNVIAMSGGGRTNPTGYLHIAKHLGASALLSKPFSNDDLQRAISTALVADRIL